MGNTKWFTLGGDRRADPSKPGDDWLWVLGHRPECEYVAVDEHPPCVELRVRAAALQGSARLG